MFLRNAGLKPLIVRSSKSFGTDAKMNDKVKVLYIAGYGRSGSTILGNVLGQVQGFVHVGEILEVWSILTSGRVPCGCGVPVVTCKMWEDVLREAYGGVDKSLIAEMLKFRNLEIRERVFLRAMTSRGVQALQRRLAGPLAKVETLYRAIQRVFNCQIIVDSSKHLMYPYMLQLTEGIDPYVLHLTRDPRASAYSFLRKRVQDGNLIWTKDRTPLTASLMWNYKHSVFEVLSNRFRHRPMRLRYEDFVANPRRSLQLILTFVGAASSSLPLQDEHSLNLEAQHTVSGNPSRFVTGQIEIRESREWETHMKMRDRILVTTTALPLMIKYGYLNRTPSLGAK